MDDEVEDSDSMEAPGDTVVESPIVVGAKLAAEKPLSPRQRKLAELLAIGWKPEKISKELDYALSRISILQRDPRIKFEIARIRERMYQDTVAKRLKDLAEPALAEIERCFADETGKYKPQLKVETAKWLIEKLDGKATQKFDMGENLLVSVMDRLDAMKSGGKVLNEMIDVTPDLLQDPDYPKPIEEIAADAMREHLAKNQEQVQKEEKQPEVQPEPVQEEQKMLPAAPGPPPVPQMTEEEKAKLEEDLLRDWVIDNL